MTQKYYTMLMLLLSLCSTLTFSGVGRPSSPLKSINTSKRSSAYQHEHESSAKTDKAQNLVCPNLDMQKYAQSAGNKKELDNYKKQFDDTALLIHNHTSISPVCCTIITEYTVPIERGFAQKIYYAESLQDIASLLTPETIKALCRNDIHYGIVTALTIRFFARDKEKIAAMYTQIACDLIRHYPPPQPNDNDKTITINTRLNTWRHYTALPLLFIAALSNRQEAQDHEDTAKEKDKVGAPAKPNDALALLLQNNAQRDQEVIVDQEKITFDDCLTIATLQKPPLRHNSHSTHHVTAAPFVSASHFESPGHCMITEPVTPPEIFSPPPFVP